MASEEARKRGNELYKLGKLEEGKLTESSIC